MITDYQSFILGLELGRRIKAWDARRKIAPPLSSLVLTTEYDAPIITESGQFINPDVIE